MERSQHDLLNKNGERARPGRSEPRPRGSHERSIWIQRLVYPHAVSFGARRAEWQPRRAHSPWIRCSLLLSALVAVAAMEPPSQPIKVPPEQAAKEGHALVNEMLSQQPEANTVTGMLAIRRDKKYTEIPIKFETVVNPTNWISDYQVTYNDHKEHILISHAPSRTNAYSQSRSAWSHADWEGTDQKVHLMSITPVKDIWAPFAGSDFSIADLGLEFLHWPDQKLLQKDMKRSRSCRVLESTNPNPRAGGYAKVKSWVDNESHGILLAQAFDAKGNKIKEFTPEDFSKVSGQWQLEKMQIRNVQTDSTTTVTFNLGK
jgi:hypothetical protein